MVNSWRQGTVEMMAHGSGGIYGGALRISGEVRATSIDRPIR